MRFFFGLLATLSAASNTDFASLKAQTLNMKNELNRESEKIDQELRSIVEHAAPPAKGSLIQLNSPEDIARWLKQLKEATGALLEKDNKRVIKTKEKFNQQFEKMKRDIDELSRGKLRRGHVSFLEVGARPPLDVDALYAMERKEVDREHPISFLQMSTAKAPLDIDALYAMERAEVDHENPVSLSQIYYKRPRGFKITTNR